MHPDGHLPVFATAAESFRFVLTHRRELMRLGVFAVPALYLLNLAFESIDWLALSGRGLNATAGKAFVDLGLRGIIATVVLVAWHRVVMLKMRTRNEPPVALGLRECRYFVVWLLLSAGFLAVFAITAALAAAFQFLAMLCVFLVVLLLGLNRVVVVGQSDQLVIVLWISIVFAVPAASYIVSRLSLVLPAMAVDRRRPWRHAWRLSAGNGWRLVGASLLVMLPMEALAAFCANAANATRATAAHYPLAFAAVLSVFLLIVLTGTVLSLFSLQLDRGRSEAAPAPSGIVPAE